MEKKQHIKDPGSAITHFIGMLMAIFAAVPLLIKAAHEPGKIYIISLAIYAASLILLYAASTTYHTFDISKKINTILKKIDQMCIRDRIKSGLKEGDKVVNDLNADIKEGMKAIAVEKKED